MNVPVELSSKYCYLAGENIRDIFDVLVFRTLGTIYTPLDWFSFEDG